MKNLDTICIHGGWKPTKGEPQQLPIYQSTTFRYETSEQMAKLFDLEESGYFYTRLANPTVDAVAKKINALEGGVGCVLTSSGQAANFYAVFNICQAGDHFITSSNIYGGTYNLFGVTMKKLGIDCTFIDPDWPDERIEREFRPNTKCFFGETISNPGGNVFDIERFAQMAHRHGVPLIVDNTFATPINCRPFEWGCDIVTHSTTKYMDGHATQVGGAVIDSGNFDWETCQHEGELSTFDFQLSTPKFPGLTTPDESYHGLTYTKAFGKMAYTTKLVAQLMRDLGSIPSPQNAFLLNIGLETLHLRMARHCANAQHVAEWLEQNPRVSWVNYAGLPNNKYYALAQKYMPNGTCGVIAFGLKGTREDAIKFMDNLDFISIVTHVADARTCVLHPASHTHRQLSDEQLREAGVAPDLIRLSVGIENVNDIIADLEQAMEKMQSCKNFTSSIMRKLFFVLLSVCFTGILHAQDIIVTRNGDALKVFNVEIGPETVFYQQSSEANAPTLRIAKKDIFVINYQDGRQVKMNEIDSSASSPSTPTSNATATSTADPAANEAAIAAMRNHKVEPMEKPSNGAASAVFCQYMPTNGSILADKNISISVYTEVANYFGGKASKPMMGEMKLFLCIKNHSTKVLYIDLANTFFIMEGRATAYYSQTITSQTQGTSTGVGLGMGGVVGGVLGIGGGINRTNSSSVTTTTIAQRIIAIPPMAEKKLEAVNMFSSNADIFDEDLKYAGIYRYLTLYLNKENLINTGESRTLDENFDIGAFGVAVTYANDEAISNPTTFGANFTVQHIVGAKTASGTIDIKCFDIKSVTDNYKGTAYFLARQKKK